VNEREWANELTSVESNLRGLQRRIDELGDAGVEIVVAQGAPSMSDSADQVACYASNSIQGTLALLRELRSLVVGGA